MYAYFKHTVIIAHLAMAVIWMCDSCEGLVRCAPHLQLVVAWIRKFKRHLCLVQGRGTRSHGMAVVWVHTHTAPVMF